MVLQKHYSFGPFQSTVHFQRTLPRLSKSKSLILFDRQLPGFNPGFNKWIRDYPHKMALASGEGLKDLHSFPQYLKRILSQIRDWGEVQLVAAGGGTIGDFSGFVASVVKRGLPLIHLPSTWLAAIDSAHGGKTALNFQGAKNQLGSFYPAEQVYIVRDLLQSQPPSRALEGRAEWIKMALLKFSSHSKSLEGVSQQDLWPLLPWAVEQKYFYLRQDPFERLGPRRLLNLGHTLGHVLEAALSLPHGRAVAIGLLFSLQWSFQLGFVTSNDFHRLEALWLEHFGDLLVEVLVPLKKSEFIRYASKDKKARGSGSLDFVFMNSHGWAFCHRVSLEAFYKGAKQWGWVR